MNSVWILFSAIMFLNTCKIWYFHRLMLSITPYVLTILSEEAENERMHLMTALQLRHPSHLFRLGVVGAQGTLLVTVTLFSTPKICQRHFAIMHFASKTKEY